MLKNICAVTLLVAVAFAVPWQSKHDPFGNFDTCPAEFPAPVACPSTCKPADDCGCARSVPDIPLDERPQIVYLTFDDGFTQLAHDTYYERLFNKQFLNPDNCSIRATHFLSHVSSDYSLINKYYNLGHEMASHSITHRSNSTYWQTMSSQEWINEMNGMKQIVSRFANIPENDIVGMRVPFLQSGGDAQYAMMKENGFLYDCSRPTVAFGFNHLDQGIWPFTMDYEVRIDCQITPCPKCSFPGVWVQPMLTLEDDRIDQCGTTGFGCPCSMLDSCIMDSTAAKVKEVLLRNFNLAYNGKTRAPIGLYVHAAWFFGAEERFNGYLDFLTEILKNKDVWIVPVKAGIDYTKNPKTNQQLIEGELPSFGCDDFPQADCSITNTCNYMVDHPPDIFNQSMYMKICDFVCPSQYPWLGNPYGN